MSKTIFGPTPKDYVPNAKVEKETSQTKVKESIVINAKDSYTFMRNVPTSLGTKKKRYTSILLYEKLEDVSEGEKANNIVAFTTRVKSNQTIHDDESSGEDLSN